MIFESRLVRSDQSGLCSAFDAHIADGHAAFHREAADRRAGVFDHVADTAVGSDLVDDAENNVL